MNIFEESTHTLTKDEKIIVTILIDRFKKKPGKDRIVTNAQIVDALLKGHNIRISGPRLRKIVQHIRSNNLIVGLIATSQGYYRTEDPKELESWIDSMRNRENAMRATREAGERDLITLKNIA